MIRTFLTHDCIGRSDTPYCLSIFLEVGLRIDVESLLEDIRKGRVDMCEYELLGELKPSIEIESPDHRFECIGEDVGILISTCERLTTRELDHVCEVESLRDLGEIASAYECGSYICELSLGLTREFTKECLSDREFEYRVTEVFETFIGLAISDVCLIEDTSVDTCEYVESRVFRKDLERREEGSYLRFELFTIVAERVAHKEMIDYRL